MLSPRNMRVLLSISRYHILTTDQIRELHFSDLDPDSEAARILLSRLLSAGLVRKHSTYARSSVAADKLSVTKPVPVWTIPKRCLSNLEKQLNSLGRSDEIQAFRCQQAVTNQTNSFSDQSLAHEIGLSQVLISFERRALTAGSIESLTWLRTSPRHSITAAKVSGNSNTTINPDAVIFMRQKRNHQRYPFIFYVEYESGTNSPAQYFKKKMTPYATYMAGRGHPPLSSVIARISKEFGLNVIHPDRLRLRVLTISKTESQSMRLHSATSIAPPRSFLFSDIGHVTDDPFGQIWLRNSPDEEPGTRYSIP